MNFLKLLICIKRNINIFKKFIQKDEKIYLFPQHINMEDLINCKKFYKNKIDAILNTKNLLTKEDLMFNEILNKKKLENFEILYSLDPLGPVIKDSDGNFYRAIYPEKEVFFKDLYESGLLQILAKNGLVPNFEISKFYVEGFSFLIKMEKVTWYNYNNFTFYQIKDLLITLLLIITVSNKYGYNLIDGDLYNMTFNKGKPIFVDFGSFIKGRSSCYKEILHKSITMLLSMSFYNNSVKITEESNTNFSVQAELLINYAHKFHKKYSSKLYNKIFEDVFYKNIIKIEYVDLLLNSKIKDTDWSNYAPTVELSDFKNKNTRFKIISDFVDIYSFDARSAIDISGNTGYFLRFLEYLHPQKYNKLINVDYDQKAISDGYAYGKTCDSIIDYALNDFRRPYPVVYKSDIVFALAMTHHLLLTQKLNIAYVFNKIKSLSNKYVYVEFCPLGMYSSHQPNILPTTPEWYNEEWFEANFKKFFKLLHKEVIGVANINNKKYPHRVLFIGEVI